jgi:hypothetical protein
VTHVNVALAAPAEAEARSPPRATRSRRGSARPCATSPYPNSGGAHRYFGADVAAILRRLDFRSAVAAPRRGGRRDRSLAVPRIGVSPRLAAVSDLAASLVRQRLAS